MQGDKLLFYSYQEFLMLKEEAGVYEVGKMANAEFMNTFYILWLTADFWLRHTPDLFF